MDTYIQSAHHVKTQTQGRMPGDTEAETGVMASRSQRRPRIVGSHQQPRGEDGCPARAFRERMAVLTP